MSDPRSWTEIMLGVPVIGGLVGVVVQQRSQVTSLQGSLDAANKALKDERESCSERIAAVEARCDKLWEIVMEGGGNGGS